MKTQNLPLRSDVLFHHDNSVACVAFHRPDTVGRNKVSDSKTQHFVFLGLLHSSFPFSLSLFSESVFLALLLRSSNSFSRSLTSSSSASFPMFSTACSSLLFLSPFSVNPCALTALSPPSPGPHLFSLAFFAHLQLSLLFLDPPEPSFLSLSPPEL